MKIPVAPSSHTPEGLPLSVRTPALDFSRVTPDWAAGDPTKTHFFHALSVLIPAVEAVVMGILRRHHPRVRNEQLQGELTSLIGQEATHARIHRAANRRLEGLGFAFVASVERFLLLLLSRVARWLPTGMALALPLTFELFTSALSAEVLSARKRWLGDERSQTSDPARLVIWHSLEELEHQSVCSDLYAEYYRGIWRPLLCLLVLVPGTILSLASLQAAFLWCDRARDPSVSLRGKAWSYVCFWWGRQGMGWLLMWEPCRRLIKGPAIWQETDVPGLRRSLEAL